jgi:K+ transporter
LEKLVNSLKGVPVLGALIKFGDERPRLAAWIVLSLGIVILLMVEARDVGLLIGQWLALIIASVLVAGLCIWIVSWEDNDEVAANGKDKAPAAAVTDEPHPQPEK